MPFCGYKFSKSFWHNDLRFFNCHFWTTLEDFGVSMDDHWSTLDDHGVSLEELWATIDNHGRNLSKNRMEKGWRDV